MAKVYYKSQEEVKLDKIEIGSVIARQRKEKGLTQKQLADTLRVSNKTISKWETGEGFPDITILPTLAEVLSITVDELLGGSPIKDRDNSGNNAIECAEYLASKTILRFKNACVLSSTFSISGVVAYWVLWHEFHNVLSILVAFIFGLVSGCISLMEYNTLQTQIKKFNGLFPEKKKNRLEIKKYLEEAICGPLLFVFVAVDFTIVNHFGNQHELIRACIEGFVYGSICIYVNAKFKKQIKL